MILSAERRRAVDRRRARDQVRDQRRAAGARPRDRGAGRAEPAGEEGRRAVPHRPDALRADRAGARGAARQHAGVVRASSTNSWPARPARSPRRAARSSAGRRPSARGAGAARPGAQARRGRTASWCRPARATASRSSRPRPICKELEAQLDTARGAAAQARAAEVQALASERQIRQRIGGKSSDEYAPVAQVARSSRTRKWELSQTTVVAPADGYAINVQLRARLVHRGVPDHAGDDLRRGDLSGDRAVSLRTSCTRSSRATRPSSR